MRRSFTLASAFAAALSVAWSATPVAAGALLHTGTSQQALRDARSSTVTRETGATPATAASVLQLDAFAGGGEQAAITAGGANPATTTPADPSVAAGASDVVEAVNSALFVYTRTGAPIGNPISINALVRTPAGWAVKNPHVVYDPFTGHFILAVLQYNTARSTCSNDGSQIEVVVSGSDPTAAWQAPRTFVNEATLPDVASGDMPVAANLALGMTSAVVVISWDYFGCLNGTFFGSQTDVIQRADLASGTLGVNSAIALTRGPLGVQPAMALGLSSVEYEIANNSNCTATASGSYAVFAITGTPDARNVNLGCAGTGADSSGTSTVPLAPQGGTSTTLDTNDDRFLDLVWGNNTLWATGNIGCTPGGDSQARSCVNVVTASATATTPVTVSAANQLPPEGLNGAYLFYPSLALDSSGDVITTFDESTTTTHEAMMVATITGGPSSPLWSSFTQLRLSPDFYSPPGCSSSCTWGDYSGAVQDPLHPTDVWVVSGDAEGTTGGATCMTVNACWNTYVGRYTFAAPSITALTPASGPGGGGQLVTVAGSDFATGTTATIGVTAITMTTGSLTPDSFTFTTPAGPAAGGVVHVVATSSLGSSSATSPGSAYLYVPLSIYTPLVPFRILDTRSTSCIQCTGGPIGANATRTVPIVGYTDPTTHEAVPSGTSAVVINVTEVGGTANSLLSVWPAGTPQPRASNLNFTAGTVTPNLVTVTLGAGGAVDIYNALGAVNVLADVEGYFAPPQAAGMTGEFHPIAPIRVCDTRSTSPTPACKAHGILNAGVPMLVTVTGIGANPIPGSATAEAAVLNLTGVASSASTYVSVYPTSSNGTCGLPRVSTLNLITGAVEANRVMVELGPGPSGPDSAVCIFTAVGRINVLLDANGWFGTATAAAGYQYQAIAPSRICDTRVTSLGCTAGAIGAGVSLARLIHVAGVGVIPGTGPVAMIANLTAIAPTTGTYLVAYPAGVTALGASDINVNAGAVLPNLIVVQLGTTAGADVGSIELFNAAGSVNAIIDVEGWFQ